MQDFMTHLKDAQEFLSLIRQASEHYIACEKAQRMTTEDMVKFDSLVQIMTQNTNMKISNKL